MEKKYSLVDLVRDTTDGVAGVARQVGVCKSNVYNWLNGRYAPGDQYVKRLIKMSRRRLTNESIQKFTTRYAKKLERSC